MSFHLNRSFTTGYKPKLYIRQWVCHSLATHTDSIVCQSAASTLADRRRIFKYGSRRRQCVDVDFTAVTSQHVWDDTSRHSTWLLQHHRSTCDTKPGSVDWSTSRMTAITSTHLYTVACFACKAYRHYNQYHTLHWHGYSCLKTV